MLFAGIPCCISCFQIIICFKTLFLPVFELNSWIILIFFKYLQIAEEKERVKQDSKSIMPAAFVSFKTRWGAAVCAQTQQTRNPTIWLTGWAPEPRDVYWPNLAIPYVHLSIRRLIMSVAFFFLTFFFIIPIAFVQSLASIEGIQRYAPFLRPLMEM